MGARESVSLTFSADLAKLQQQLSKIPNMTEKEARIAVKSLERQYGRAEKAAKRAAQSSKKQFAGIVKAAAALDIADRIASVASAVVDLGQKFADLNNQLSDASARTGASVEMLNGLKLAAEGSGLSFEVLEKGVGKLPKAMADAARGSGAAARAFDDLGVKADADGKLRDTDDVLRDIFTGLSKVESPAQRAAMAMDIFGQKAGPAFIQSGAIDNLDAFVTLANEYGLDVGPQATATAAEFQRQMATLSAVSVGEMQKVLGAFGGPGGLNSLIELTTKSVIVVGTVFESVFSQMQENILMLTGPLAEVAAQMAEGDIVGAFRAMQRTSGEFAAGLAGLVPGVNAIRLVDAALEGASDAVERYDKAIAAMHATIDGGSSRDGLAENSASEMEEAEQARLEAALAAEKERISSRAAAAASERAADAAAEAAAAREQYSARVERAAKRAESLAKAEEELSAIRLETAEAEATRNDDAARSAQLRYEVETAALQARIDAAIEMGASEVEAAEVYQARLTELELDRIETIRDAEATQAEQRAADREKQISDILAVTSAYTDLGQAATRAVVDDRLAQGAKLKAFLENNEESLSKAQKKRIRGNLREQAASVRKAFRLQQSADVAAVAQNTAVAVMKAYATLPTPAAIAATPGIVALGGVQAAAVMQQKPPTFDLGGMVPMGTQAGSGRHTPAMLEQGEGVLTRQGVAAAGGPEGLEALNAGRGGAGGGPVQVNLMLRHRVLDTVMSEHASRGGTGSQSVTRTNPYRGVPR